MHSPILRRHLYSLNKRLCRLLQDVCPTRQSDSLDVVQVSLEWYNKHCTDFIRVIHVYFLFTNSMQMHAELLKIYDNVKRIK